MKYCEITKLQVIDNSLVNTELGYISVERHEEFDGLYPDAFTPWHNDNFEGLADKTVSIVDKVSADGPYILVSGLTSYTPIGLNEITDLNNL